MSGICLSSWFASPARWGRLYRRTFLQVRRRPNPRRSTSDRCGWGFVALAVLVTLAGAGLRASFLNHPMRYDESWVYFRYIGRSVHDLATCYEWAANHLLYSVLEHEAVRLGGDSPPMLRLPAFLAGTALIPLAITLGWAVTRRRGCSLAAGGLVSASCVLVDYSTNARGYTMLCAFTMGMCLCTVLLVRAPRRRRLWPTWALLGALGALTIPTMLLPVAGLAAVIALDALLMRRRRRRRIQLARLAVTLASWALLTALLYLPALVRAGPAQMLAAGDAVRRYSERYFNSTYHVAWLTGEEWARDLAWPALVIGGAGMLLTLVHALRKRSALWSLPWVMLAVGAGLAVSLPARPYPRVWLYLLPVVLTFAACGLALIRPVPLRRSVIAVLGAALLASGYSVGRRQCLVAEIPPTLVDAAAVAQMCAEFPNREFGLVMFPMTDAVRYYAHRQDLPRPAHPTDSRVRATYVVVNWCQSLEEVLDIKGETWVHQYGSPVLCLTLPHSRVYRMERADASRDAPERRAGTRQSAHRALETNLGGAQAAVALESDLDRVSDLVAFECVEEVIAGADDLLIDFLDDVSEDEAAARRARGAL